MSQDTQWEKGRRVDTWGWENWITTGRKMRLEPHTVTHVSPEWLKIKDFHRPETLSSWEKIRKRLFDIGLHDAIMDQKHKLQNQNQHIKLHASRAAQRHEPPGKHKSNPQWEVASPVRAPTAIHQQTTSAGEDVGKGHPSPLWVGCIWVQPLWETVWGSSGN